ncbi:hypothetical protein Tco_0143829 [Tanacetum coccineum]
MGLTINEDEENMMDDLMWGHVCETKHATTHIRDNEGRLMANRNRMDVIIHNTNKYKPVVDVDGPQCESKDTLHVEVQDVPAHGIGVNTISEVDEAVVSDGSEVDEVMDSAPQVDVDDA